MSEAAKQLAKMLEKSKRTVFFGGAGVSTESGIPDFRSAHGLYGGAKGKSYEDMLHIRYFLTSPDEFWAFYKNVMLYPDAKPNAAHVALARLEAAGKLDCVLTQNIDGLHQAAGSRKVLELHGSVHRNTCMRCGRQFDLAWVLSQEGTPHCPCGGLVRPDVVLYGEPLDDEVLEAAVRAVRGCDLLIVGGTSLVVHPAAGLVGYLRAGVPLVLINRDETPYDSLAALVIRENIAEVLDEAVRLCLGQEPVHHEARLRVQTQENGTAAPLVHPRQRMALHADGPAHRRKVISGRGTASSPARPPRSRGGGRARADRAQGR